MQYFAPPLAKLIEHFAKMPTVGRKGAQRLAFYILSLSEQEVNEFAQSIINAKKNISFCTICQHLTDSDVCSICADDKRDKSIICVVQSPKDIMAFEKTMEYKGTYHVLHGAFSPMNKIGPGELKVKELIARLGDNTVKEVIMATNGDVEGETTALYLSKLIKPLGILVTRLAYGISVGSNLEYADEVTLTRAIEGRREI